MRLDRLTLAMVCVLALGGAGCGDDDGRSAVDAGADAGAPTRDAGADAGGRVDAGPSLDAGTDAAAALDAGADAGDDAGDDAGQDAGPDDAGPDDTSCDDVHAGAIFCDGFETGLGAWSMTTASATGMVDTVATPAFRGHAALRARTLASTSLAYALASPLGARTSGDLYFRMWMRIPAGVPVTTVYTLAAHESVAPRNGFDLGTVTASTATATLSTAAHAFSSTDAVFGRDTWACVEAHVLIAASGTFEVWVDGTAVVADTGRNTLPASGYSDLLVGILGVEAGQPPTTVYLDEVVVDTARIGCVD